MGRVPPSPAVILNEVKDLHSFLETWFEDIDPQGIAIVNDVVGHTDERDALLRSA